MGKPSEEQTLVERIDAYFTACDETETRFTLKNGAVGVRQVPYTLAGLAESLGTSQQAIRQKARAGGRIGKLYANAMRRIERYTVERALLGELQSSVAASLLRDLGSGEKLQPDGDADKLVIVLEDKEGWSE